MLRTFSYEPSVCLLWKNVYSDSLPFLIEIFFFFAIELFELIFDISLLLDIWVANIFSCSLDHLLILSMISFAVQKLFILVWSPCLF